MKARVEESEKLVVWITPNFNLVYDRRFSVVELIQTVGDVVDILEIKEVPRTYTASEFIDEVNKHRIRLDQKEESNG